MQEHMPVGHAALLKEACSVGIATTPYEVEEDFMTIVTGNRQIHIEALPVMYQHLAVIMPASTTKAWQISSVTKEIPSNIQIPELTLDQLLERTDVSFLQSLPKLKILVLDISSTHKLDGNSSLAVRSKVQSRCELETRRISEARHC